MRALSVKKQYSASGLVALGTMSDVPLASPTDLALDLDADAGIAALQSKAAATLTKTKQIGIWLLPAIEVGALAGGALCMTALIFSLMLHLAGPLPVVSSLIACMIIGLRKRSTAPASNNYYWGHGGGMSHGHHGRQRCCKCDRHCGHGGHHGHGHGHYYCGHCR